MFGQNSGRSIGNVRSRIMFGQNQRKKPVEMSEAGPCSNKTAVEA
ncbi:hypothetical protein [Bacillus sp. ISL-55]|nr:hypothetical protein [Bacillus sp. ISL-55]